ncbi:MAG TPA: response regulator transcription factor [Bacteroidota bacterium]|jgi:DNA-binding NarL/FixJ family response regulator
MISVAIVEDTHKIREGLTALLDGSPGFECVGAYASAEEAIESIPLKEPDVVLMDINLPGISGIECTRELKRINPETLIMILTVFDTDDKVFESLKAGANGYVLKRTPPAELLAAIQNLSAGGAPMSGEIARKVVGAFHEKGSSSDAAAALSPREYEILTYLAKGYRYKEIAEELHISVETVRTHLHNVYEKLHVRSRTEAVLKIFPK